MLLSPVRGGEVPNDSPVRGSEVPGACFLSLPLQPD